MGDPGRDDDAGRARRVPGTVRRAMRPGSNPKADESPEVAPGPTVSDDADRDRWLREQRPPHWE